MQSNKDLCYAAEEYILIDKALIYYPAGHWRKPTIQNAHMTIAENQGVGIFGFMGSCV